MLHKNYLPPYPNPNPNLAHNSSTECLWVKCTVTLNQFSGTNRGQGLTIADLHVVLIPTIYSLLLAQSVLYFTHKKLFAVILNHISRFKVKVILKLFGKSLFGPYIICLWSFFCSYFTYLVMKLFLVNG